MPANCGFGGREMSTLFITARKGLYSVEMSVRCHSTKR
jgi:sugar lactone lactonase YvrE